MRTFKALIILATMLLGTAHAATRYASPSGSGSACTEISTPCTLSTAVSQMVASDTLFLLDGVYNQTLTNPLPSGTVGAPTVMEGQSLNAIMRPSTGSTILLLNSDRANITFRKFTIDGINLGTASQKTGFQTNSVTVITNLTVEDMDIKQMNGTALTLGDAVDGCTIRRNKLHDGLGTTLGISNGGIYHRAKNCLVENNDIYGIAEYAVTIRSDLGGGTGNTYRYNIIRDSSTLVGLDSGLRALNVSRPDNSFYNNLIINNLSGGVSIGAANTLFYNNTVYGNAGYGVRITTGVTGANLTNNIIYGNGSGISDSGTATTVTNNTTTDPSFIAAGSNNFNVPSGQASNGTDLTASGVLDNNSPGRGALDPMEFASATTVDSNTIRVTLHNSFGALRNATTTTGWSCKVNTVAKTVTAASTGGATVIDLDINATMISTDTVICSYDSTTGSLLNSLAIGNKTDATGNAYLLSFTDQAVTNTLTGSGPGDTPPTIGTVAYSEETADTTTVDIVMPASIVTGDLLLAFLSFNGVPTISTFTGWTQMCYTTNTNVASAWYYKIAAGGETDTTYTISSAEDSTTRTWRIPVAEWHGTTPPECAIATGASTTPDPPNLTPSWGAENLLWAAAYSRFRGDVALVSYPTNFDDNQYTDSTGTTTDTVAMAIASRSLNAASLDPGVFTVAGSQNWIASTISVRPVSSGGDTGEDLTVWEQRNYCWKDWQDAETVACKIAQDTAITGHPNAKIVARIGIGITTDNPDPVALVGQYKVSGINAIDWTPLTDSCTAPCVKYVAPSVRSNGEATTRLLTLPGGLTFAAGALQAQSGASATFDYSQNAWVEFDQAIQLVGLSSGDVVEIRMVKDGGNLLNTYTRNATLNVIGMEASAP